MKNRPLPFSPSSNSRLDSALNRHSRRRRRRSSGDSGSDINNRDGIIRSLKYTIQAFRFHCRSGQLLLAEQLALGGVWNVGTSVVGGGVSSDDDKNGGTGKAVKTSEGLRAAWMATRLKPAMRLALKERREKVRQALEDVRRFEGARGAIFVLPRIGVETTAAAAAEWDVRVVPSQRDVIRGEWLWRDSWEIMTARKMPTRNCLG